MSYSPRDWNKPRTCQRPECGKRYLPTAWNQKYCSLECKTIICKANFRSKNPEYWREYTERRKTNNKKKPDNIWPPYNPEPCRLCKLPLGKTWNRYYHNDCHHRITQIVGIEEC